MTETRTATARRSAAPARGSSTSDGRPDRASAGSWPVRERSLIGPVLGIPPLVAVALAVGLTAIGVVVDLLRVGTVATIFEIGYGAGCLLAVSWVRRRSIFLPAIQPPLLLAVVVPVLAVLVGAPSSTAGVTEHLLLAGAPLINAFPAMAVTTLLVLLVAGYRLVRQRTGPDDAVGLLRARLSGRRADDDGDAGADRRGGRDAGDRDGVPERGRPARRTPRADESTTGKGRAERGRTTQAKAATGTDKPAGTGRDRTGSSRARTDRGATSKDAPRSGSGRSGARDRRPPSDDAPPDAGRRSVRGSTGRGTSRAGRPVRDAGDGARSRRPRPTDPT